MKKNIRTLLLCMAVFLIIVGCVSSTPFRKMDAKETKVAVYVFRPESILSRGTIIGVYFGDEKKGELINNSYLPLEAAPGNIEIILRTNDFVKNKYASMVLSNAKAGDEYFIKAKPGAFGAFELIKLDASTAMAEIGATQYYQKK